MFKQDNTCPAYSFSHHESFVYGAITHYGGTFQSLPLKLKIA